MIFYSPAYKGSPISQQRVTLLATITALNKMFPFLICIVQIYSSDFLEHTGIIESIISVIYQGPDWPNRKEDIYLEKYVRKGMDLVKQGGVPASKSVKNRIITRQNIFYH